MSLLAASLSADGSQDGESKTMFLRSSLLDEVVGITHGFTTREGGLSPKPRDSLNLGRKIGDPPSIVSVNRKRVLEELGLLGHQWVSVTQVHGDHVVEVTPNANKGIEADGLWTKSPSAAIAITVADCVPLLFAHRSGRAVAAVHAGWRGSVAKIGAKMVERFEKAGFKASDLVVAMGPAIGPCCFEIGSDVVAAIEQAFPSANAVTQSSNEKCFADLWELNRLALEEAGIMASQIDNLNKCTFCSSKMFSYRRDQGQTGRQAGVIARV